MAYRLVRWALEKAPMLRNGKGNNTAARLNLIARCEIQREEGGTHYLSHADMEFRTGLRRTAIIESNKALEDAGLIARTGEKTRDGIDIYSINSALVRVDGVADIRENREKARNHRKPTGTDSEPGAESEPGADSEPLTGADSEPGGSETPPEGVRSPNPNRTQYITVKNPSVAADASTGELFGVDNSATKKRKGGEHPAFQSFWDLYMASAKANGGRTGNRFPASQSFSKAIKGGATPEQIMTAVTAYMASRDPRRGYVQNASTWLNQRGWETPWEPDTGPATNTAVAGRRLQTHHGDDPFAA